MSYPSELLDYLPQKTRIGLQKADQKWTALKQGKIPTPQVINQNNDALETVDYDVVISGGTLGILLATALQQRGWKVALIERGKLRGRDQEWNISRSELEVFCELDLLSEGELEKAIATEYNPARVSFHQGREIWVKNVLNIGVDPVFLLETLKQKFLAANGKLLEETAFQSATIHPNGVKITTDNQTLTTRLLIDAMGNFSPIVAQARNGEKPEGVCLVVGSCATGYPENKTGDLIASFTPIENQCQYFWEAFPARDGRTTYLFTYLDAQPNRFSLEFFMAEYLRLLPQYQGVDLSQLDFKRFLFGFFPSYRHSPLRVPWQRLLPVGDSSGAQSPVSFGGFGSMVRHLKRLTQGIAEALETDSLSRADLALLQPYQPNMAVTWLFQRTMSVEGDRPVPPNQINDLMNGVFAVMEDLGDEVLKPFLQDVIQFGPLAKTLPRVPPQLVLPILPQVGIPLLWDWLKHYLSLGTYSGLYPLGKALEAIASHLPAKQQYYYYRWLDAWQYGSGND
ncbi:MAG: FAD-binding oxidoreductase [Jaaginema sp. PMC 1079.18]|nr:FAD-binding oxidoreductase [Jaaginema sp. PMC 1080.18]MEC4854119.1 FAD-binding oxidoreductase [Jaaginema sp. PMC 1079.18]